MPKYYIYFPKRKMNTDCLTDIDFEKVFELTVDSLNDCFCYCQNGENPKYAKTMLRSLSIGDLILDYDEQDVYMVMPIGFNKLNILLPELKGKMYDILMNSNHNGFFKLRELVELAVKNSLINTWEQKALYSEIEIMVDHKNTTHMKHPRTYILEEEQKNIEQLKERILVLSNGKQVANFSSPHSFTFTDGSVLKEVSNELANKLAVKFNESSYDEGDIKLTFELTSEIREEMDKWENLWKQGYVDVVFCPLPMIQCIPGVQLTPFRSIRIEDRVKKLVSIDKQCF